MRTLAPVCDIEARRPGYSLARLRAALAGHYDAARLSDGERALFDDLLGEALDTIQTPAARAFWATFEHAPNTDAE